MFCYGIRGHQAYKWYTDIHIEKHPYTLTLKSKTTKKVTFGWTIGWKVFLRFVYNIQDLLNHNKI